MKTFTRLVYVVALLFCASRVPAMEEAEFDVVIYGATPSGISAAIASARCGATVLLAERHDHIGGLMTNGLGATDIKNRDAIAGIFLEYVTRVRKYYAEKYGANSAQARASRDGYFFEPHVAELILNEMIHEQPSIKVAVNAQLKSVRASDDRIRQVGFTNRTDGTSWQASAKVYIDSTYEGDLAALAGNPYRVGREARHELGEPYAGVVYWDYVKRIYYDELSTGEGDKRIQAYNYRLPLTSNKENMVRIEKPANYNRFEYMLITRQVRLGEVKNFQQVVHIVPMPNGKSDTNNHTIPLLSTDLPEENYPYPEADWEWRDRFAKRLREYTLGLIYFCQNDLSLPEDFRIEASRWGLAKDEYVSNGHFPRQMYVREARRIQGEYLFKAQDALITPGHDRTPIQKDSIACGSYEIDSHPTRKYEPGIPVLEGLLGVIQYTYVYQIPYGVLVPTKIDNLLVSTAVSSTHLGFSTIRMEPCWMALGQAAGTAAFMSIGRNQKPRDLDVASLQRKLLDDRAVIMYHEDVTLDNPNRKAIQFFGSRGWLTDSYNSNESTPVDRGTAVIWMDNARRIGLFNPGGIKRVSPFIDMPKDHPSAAAARSLAERGVLKREALRQELRPYESLTPDQMRQWFEDAGIAKSMPQIQSRAYVTRGQFLTALYNMHEASEQKGKQAN